METARLICPSKIVSVVVYARGAIVTRRAELPETIAGGPVEIILPGVTALAEPGSLRADVEGGREVVGVHSHLVHPEALGDPGVLRARVEALEDTADHLRAQRALGESSRDRLLAGELRMSATHRLRQDPRGRFSDALAASSIIDVLAADEDEKLAALDRDVEDNTMALEAARLALSQATADESARGSDPERRILVQLAPGEGGLVRLEVSYAVSAARWWPAYAVRLDPGALRGRLSLEAFVAQSSGEDWEGVRLGLCTADMIQDIRLPELPSLRLGRRQTPRRTGYRALPTDLNALFEGFDAAWRVWSPPAPVSAGSRLTQTGSIESGEALFASLHEARDKMESEADLMVTRAGSITQTGAFVSDDSSGADLLRKRKVKEKKKSAPPLPPARPAPMPMAPMSQSMMMPASAKSGGLFSFGGGGGMSRSASSHYRADVAPPAPPAEEEVEVFMVSAEAWLRFDMLVMKPPRTSSARGSLEVRPAPIGIDDRGRAASAIASMSSPFGTSDPATVHRFFDHRYDAAGVLDVPSSGQAHRLSLSEAEAESRPTFITNPQQTAEVYREIQMTNPFGAPLLAGPIDVFVGGALVRTSPLPAVDRGGEIRFGLGAEERIRVVRKAVTREVSVGLLKGTTHIETTITIELASALGIPAPITVFDRMPVTWDKEVDIERTASSPPAEEYDQKERGKPVEGGLQWHIEIAPGGAREVEFSYTIALPSKLELVGGNRRE